jgi:DNA helicase-2/ATP-dependent DNA helicase PcrA
MYPRIVLGPPGTGKTTRLLGMVEEDLSRGIGPEEIAYVSFTKKAASEATTRACEKFGFRREQLRYFRTLHSMCFQSLGLSNSDVFEGKKVVEFGHWLGIELSEMRFSDDGLLTGFTPGDRAIFMENLARVRGVSLRDQYDLMHDNLGWNFVSWVARGLSDYKTANALLDYTDMLEHFVRQEWTPPLRKLYVDEAQDQSMLQWQVVEKLASTCEEVVIAGDDDQAIYRWAGAATEHFVDLPGQASVLGQSWRCPPEVQSLSHEIISRVQRRRPKEWAPRDGAGVVDRAMRFDQIDLGDGPDILVLARNAFVIRDLLPDVRSDGIIYEYKGHTSVSKPILDAVRIWERLRSGESVTGDDARGAYEYLPSGQTGVLRGFKKLPSVPPAQPVDMQYLREQGGLATDLIWHEAMTRIPQEEKLYLLKARKRGESTSSKPRVRFSTIHGAKGGEADHVVLLTDVANRTYGEMQESPDDEARVWYVAVTRARQRLTIVAPQTGMHYDV